MRGSFKQRMDQRTNISARPNWLWYSSNIGWWMSLSNQMQSSFTLNLHHFHFQPFQRPFCFPFLFIPNKFNWTNYLFKELLFYRLQLNLFNLIVIHISFFYFLLVSLLNKDFFFSTTGSSGSSNGFDESGLSPYFARISSYFSFRFSP